MIRPLVAVFAVAVSCGVAHGFTVDADMPAGNVIVEKIDGDLVELKKDMRDTNDLWIYWAFRVKGANGRTLKFKFLNGPSVGSRGAAVSTDSGRHWRWSDFEMNDPRDSVHGNHASLYEFTWTFGADEGETWFCQTIPYTQNDWERFVASHE